MHEADKIHALVAEWVAKAENDLTNAAHALKLGHKCPTDTVGFHVQQCAEKYIKAVLVLNAVDFPRVHDIEMLVELLPNDVLAEWPIDEQRTLTSYATMTRYPGDYEPISLAEARGAVRIARRIRSAIRRLLPRPALRLASTKRATRSK